MSKAVAFIERIKRLKGPLAAIAAGGAVVGGLAGYWNGYHVVSQAVGEPVANAQAGKANIPADADPLSILVLPFANQTGDANKAYIADALTSSISADLNRIRDAFVVPTSSAFTYKDKNLTVAQVGKDAGVRFVLQGSVVASADKLRISAQLADTQSGKQLWNETFEGDAANMFELQDLVTARIGNSIGDQLVIVAARDSEKRKSSHKVADLMMRQRALGLKPFSPETLGQQEALLRMAIQKEPDNPQALAALARVLVAHAWNFLDASKPEFRPMFEEAHGLALRAKAIDDQLRDVYTALWLYSAVIEKDRSQSRHYLEMAIKVAPKNPHGFNNLAVWYISEGQPRAAIETLNNALALYSKGEDFIFGNMARSCLMLGDNEAAIDWEQKALDSGATIPEAFSTLAMAHANLGQMDKAGKYANEYKQRMAQLGRRGEIEKLDGSESPAWVKYYTERYLPEWRKAGLPE